MASVQELTKKKREVEGQLEEASKQLKELKEEADTLRDTESAEAQHVQVDTMHNSIHDMIVTHLGISLAQDFVRSLFGGHNEDAEEVHMMQCFSFGTDWCFQIGWTCVSGSKHLLALLLLRTSSDVRKDRETPAASTSMHTK